MLAAHPRAPTILTIHELVDADGDGTPAHLSDFGRHVWDTFVSGHDQVFLSLNGHFWPPGRTTLTNAAGQPVHAHLTNYQDRYYGGAAMIRLYRFDLERGAVDVSTVNPWFSSVPYGQLNELAREEVEPHRRPGPLLHRAGPRGALRRLLARGAASGAHPRRRHRGRHRRAVGVAGPRPRRPAPGRRPAGPLRPGQRPGRRPPPRLAPRRAGGLRRPPPRLPLEGQPAIPGRRGRRGLPGHRGRGAAEHHAGAARVHHRAVLQSCRRTGAGTRRGRRCSAAPAAPGRWARPGGTPPPSRWRR